MKIYKFLFYTFLTVLSISFFGCGKGKDIPNVSEIPVSVQINRFDHELFKLDTTDMVSSLATLEATYPEFSEIYFTHVLGLDKSKIDDMERVEIIQGFITDPAVKKLYDTCQVLFPSEEKVKKDFEQAFRFFKYYFPNQPLSEEVFTYISEYSLGGFLFADNSIGVGLDFYLGSGYPYLSINPGNANFSAYLTRTFTKEHLVLKAVMMLVQDLNGQPSGGRLLDFMMHKGKEMYIIGKLLPYEADSIVAEFSAAQLKWCIENESNIWAYLVSENLLYSPDFNKFRKLVEYSPNSPGMPEEAPGRTASWLGKQIVEAYMKRHPETTLEELIAMKDSQVLLDLSKYKPPR